MAAPVNLQEFYETFPYPHPDEDLDSLQQGTCIAVGNARDWFHCFFPDRPFTQEIDILVAGCGTNQAARLSLCSPEAKVTAIDISRVSLESTKQLKDQYRLSRLEVKELPIEEISQLGQDFDLIYCTGVLHHLADPREGLRALRGVLRPAGSIQAMVYAHQGRLTTTMVQDLLRRVGAKPDPAGVEKARRWVRALPPEHPFVSAAEQLRDLESDAGVADLLLNPRERSYTVPEVYGLLGRTGMRLQRFFHQAYYLPRCFLRVDSPLLADIQQLLPEKQHAVGEFLRGSIRKHDFIACRDDRPEPSYRLDFSGDDCLDYIPICLPGLRAEKETLDAAAKLHSAAHEFEDLVVCLDKANLRLFEAVDGKRDIAAVADSAGMTHRKQRDQVREFFCSMWEHDFMVFSIPHREQASQPRVAVLPKEPESRQPELARQSKKGANQSPEVSPAARTSEFQSPLSEPRRLNVGCGRNTLPGWINLDVVSLPGVDFVADLERCQETPLPFPDDHFDEFLLSHVLEHIQNTLPLMQELHRVAKPNALATIRLPHGASDDAFEDPTHVRPYFINSFGYFSQPFYWRADYGYRGDWEVKQITLIVSRASFAKLTTQQILKKVRSERNVVQEVVAELEAVKPIREPRKEFQTQPAVRIVMQGH